MGSPGHGDRRRGQSHRLLLTAALADRSEAVHAWGDWCAAFKLDSLDGEGYWILPLVYQNLSRANFSGPEKQRLAGVYKQMRLANAIRRPRFLELTGFLQDAGTQALPGPLGSIALLHEQLAISMDPAELLVPVAAIEFVDELLQSRGWVPLVPLPAARLRAFVPRVRYRSEEGTELRICWRPFGLDSPVEHDAGCWRRASAQLLDGRVLKLADRNDLLKMARRMESMVQAAVVKQHFAPSANWRGLEESVPQDGSTPLRVLAGRHWRRYRNCPKQDRPAGFITYLVSYHAYCWRTGGVLQWLLTAIRRAARPMFG